MGLSRRHFVGAAGALSIPAALTACGGFSTSDSSSSGGADSLSFTTWGTDAELGGFRKAIKRFEDANSGTKVSLNSVPYEQMFTNIDAQLQSGKAPDIFRVPYYTFGSYAGRGQLLDLSKHLKSGFSEQFTPQAWAAVQNESKPFGVPHHTDTSCILYNKAMLKSAGVTNIPTSLKDAWTWQELEEVGQKLRKSLPNSKYPFAYNWQGNGVTRWLSLLFQADGRFLGKDLMKSAIDSEAGRQTVDFTKGFFTKGFVPKNDSVKSSTYASDTWYSQTVAMVWGGAFLLPDAAKTLDFEWGATYATRKARGGSDFGGNALVATKGTKKPELATKFLEFMAQEQSMRDFCEASSLLPTRKDLVKSGIKFAERPELSRVFLDQASTVRPADSAQVASPNMSAIITVLKDQLEKAFIGGQSTDETIAGLDSGINGALKP